LLLARSLLVINQAYLNSTDAKNKNKESVMRINNNNAAFNTWTSYTKNQDALKKSMSRLSTGVIQSTDDPAGIGISERMRAQIKGVEMARFNTDNAISLVQTADSWLQKINDMLARMKSLSIEAAGIMSGTDKDNLQVEFEAMQEEITRITSKDNAAGKFNGLYLFRGGNGTSTFGDEMMTTPGRPATATSPQQLALSSAGAADTSIISLAGGGYIIADEHMGGTDVQGVQLYDAEGNKVNAPNYSTSGIAGITALKTGGFVAVVEGTNSSYLQRYDRYGNKEGASIDVGFSLNSIDTSNIIALDDGDILVTNSTGDRLVRLDADTDYTPPISIEDINPGLSLTDAKVTAFPNGEFVIANTTNSPGELTRYDAYGIKLDSFATVSTSIDADSQLISMKGGGFALLTGDTVKVFSADGAQVGDTVSFTTDPKGITPLKDGGFMATTVVDNKLLVDRYTVDGNNINLFESFQVNKATESPENIDIAVLSNGDFVVEWREGNESYTRKYEMDDGISIQIGADINQTLSLELPDLQITNHEIIGSFNKIKYNADNSVQEEVTVDVRWSDIIDPKKMNVTSDDVTGYMDVAINYVSRSRALMAAQQNRLQNTKEGLLTYQDNLSAAESKIRDVDMARESTALARNQVLANASNAMLAQANQLPQSVLQLLG
jgi:flagellin